MSPVPELTTFRGLTADPAGDVTVNGRPPYPDLLAVSVEISPQTVTVIVDFAAETYDTDKVFWGIYFDTDENALTGARWEDTFAGDVVAWVESDQVTISRTYSELEYEDIGSTTVSFLAPARARLSFPSSLLNDDGKLSYMVFAGNKASRWTSDLVPEISKGLAYPTTR